MHENEAATWLARDGDGQVLEVDASTGYPGREASPDDGRPVTEAAAPHVDWATEDYIRGEYDEELLLDPTEWEDRQQERADEVAAARAGGRVAELEPEAG